MKNKAFLLVLMAMASLCSLSAQNPQQVQVHHGQLGDTVGGEQFVRHPVDDQTQLDFATWYAGMATISAIPPSAL